MTEFVGLASLAVLLALLLPGIIREWRLDIGSKNVGGDQSKSMSSGA